MKFSRKQNPGPYKTAFLISFILHGFVFVLFFIINIETPERKIPGYIIINFSSGLQPVSHRGERTPSGGKAKTEIKNGIGIKVKKQKFPLPEKKNHNKVQPVQKNLTGIINDTTEKSSPLYSISDSTQYDLNFARSLLDTFLVKHPEYSSLILKEQSKELKDKKLTAQSPALLRATIERKLNEEIHKYLASKFPEGSEHAMNKYTGPGLQIPIGDLIDMIKKILK